MELLAQWLWPLLQFQFIFDHNDLKVLANFEGEKRYLILIHFFGLLIRLTIFVFIYQWLHSFFYDPSTVFLSFASPWRDYGIKTSWANCISGFVSSDGNAILFFQERQTLTVSTITIKNDSNQKFASYVISKTKQLRLGAHIMAFQHFCFCYRAKPNPQLTEMVRADLHNQGCYSAWDTQFCLISYSKPIPNS